MRTLAPFGLNLIGVTTPRAYDALVPPSHRLGATTAASIIVIGMARERLAGFEERHVPDRQQRRDRERREAADQEHAPEEPQVRAHRQPRSRDARICDAAHTIGATVRDRMNSRWSLAQAPSALAGH